MPPIRDRAAPGFPSVSRRAVFAWCLYDFANSPFTTLVVTFIYGPYFIKGVVGDEIRGTALWSQAVTAAALTVAFLSPLLGAVADRGGYRKPFLLAGTLVTVGGCLALFGAGPGEIALALAAFLVADVAFEMAMVFYNAYLPDLAPRERIGRISGYGWALGYVGGILALVVALVGFVQPQTPWFGISREGGAHIRATVLLAGIWFAVLSIPAFLWLPRERPAGLPREGIWRGSFGRLRETFTHVRRYRQIVRLLVARLVYNDALVTIFAFGGIYAEGTFGFTFSEIIVFGIALNVAAAAGALAFGFLDDAWGGKRTIAVSLGGLLVASLLAVLAPGKVLFWVAGVLVGIFSGPCQSASRSLLGRFVPDDMESEFFGFFAFSGKATAFVGPLLLGSLTAAFGSQRMGVAVVPVLLVVGLFLLRRVDEAEGVRVRETSSG